MERLTAGNTGEVLVFEFKPKLTGTLKQGRSPRNVERWLAKKQARLEARGNQRFSANGRP